MLVSVCCLTYNHEKTIAQAIEGIVRQKTSFPFELIIHDDASTDGTTEIVRQYSREYPDIIVPIIQTENQFRKCNLAKTYVNPVAKGQYIAICEGDDYWSDPYKLQKQIDYMEAHPQCTMTFHAIEQLNGNGTKEEFHPRRTDGEVPTEEVIRRGGMFCPSVSLVVRRDICEMWPQFREKARIYDFPLQILAAINGSVYYFDDIMGVYRYAAEGSWTRDHVRETDYEHMRLEEDWLQMFNEYTQNQYKDAVNYHLARLWSIEYRNNRNKLHFLNAKKYAKLLSGADAWKIYFRLICYKLGGFLWKTKY